MEVLCSGKTGTITEGRMRVHAVLDAGSHESERQHDFRRKRLRMFAE